jgi:hypothetical protein
LSSVEKILIVSGGEIILGTGLSTERSAIRYLLEVV